jgi:putative sterol carrier protein
MVDDEVRAIFTQRKGHPFDPRLARAKGTYRFEIEGVGVWRMFVDHGTIAIEEGGGDADCVVTVSDPTDFIRIARGEQNLITAFMQGRVDMHGDAALAQLLHSLLPPPPQHGHGREEVAP